MLLQKYIIDIYSVDDGNTVTFYFVYKPYQHLENIPKRMYKKVAVAVAVRVWEGESMNFRRIFLSL